MSEDAKKFLLIDASNIDQLMKHTKQNERLIPIEKRELKRIDKFMLDIINNSALTEDEKVMEYNKVLTEFQSLSNIRSMEPSQTKTVQNEKQQVDKITSDYDATVGVQQRYKNKANNVMSLLKMSKQFDITNSGELIVNNEKINGSNISDLLNKAINPNHNVQDIPGWEEFQEILIKSNIPKSLLATNILKPIKHDTPIAKQHNKIEPTMKHNKMLRKWKPYDA